MVAMNKESVTVWLRESADGNPNAEAARAKLFETTYEELRRLANQMMSRQTSGHTLQPTALVNEATMRLIGAESLSQIANSKHFYAATAKAMRCVLVDHARKRKSQRRGGEYARKNLDIVLQDLEAFNQGDLLELDEALTRLGELEQRHAELVQLRFFLGLTIDEIAEQRGVSKSTIERDWRFVRAWLAKELDR